MYYSFLILQYTKRRKTYEILVFFEKSGRILNNNPKCPKTVELIEIGRPQAILLHQFDIY